MSTTPTRDGLLSDWRESQWRSRISDRRLLMSVSTSESLAPEKGHCRRRSQHAHMDASHQPHPPTWINT